MIGALIASLLAFMVVALSMGQVVTAAPASEAVESVEPTTALRMSTPAAVGATQTDGQEFCNTAPTTVTFMPSGVVATPYPSTITVSGADAVTSLVTVRLAGVSHTRPRDLDVMLVSPTGQNFVLMSDTGGGSGTPTSADLTFSDTASGSVPDDVRLFTGTFLPTNVGSDDVWPTPAPAASSATTLDTFIGANPNGVWSLFVVDDHARLDAQPVAVGTGGVLHGDGRG